MNASTLTLKIHLQDSMVYFNKPFQVKVTLENTSKDTLMVNKRLSVGYENSISRELYFNIIDANTKEVIGIPTESYDRPPTYFNEYGVLKPKESISTTFDLSEWQEIHLPKGKHQLEIVAFYQADEDYFDKRPENVVQGLFQSEPVTFYWIQK
ncbi:hypothetical protein ACFO3O_14470 [Dokdonia ponticola]|uniref:Uncharacterized protein n=1 Tax=Dokdonia ponticola TaxID=2041041 RepID=A0ABV9I040_9FLAO